MASLHEILQQLWQDIAVLVWMQHAVGNIVLPPRPSMQLKTAMTAIHNRGGT
ncbi:hypothetical protein [Nostoc sp. UHCC 0302]|uniref:hypothetical protein n=1 Tax=Nostoc sp. UHCC 0302 TaxID=3134896 RepID=UPI00311CCB02